MNVTEHIESLMREREWTIYRLGKETGLSQSTLAHVFRRDSAPTIATLEIICKAFGISLSQFFSNGDSYALTEEQEKLLSDWATLTKEQKQLLWIIIDALRRQGEPEAVKEAEAGRERA